MERINTPKNKVMSVYTKPSRPEVKRELTPEEELGRKIAVQFIWDITSPIFLMFLWNWIMPGLFGLATIGYLKALGIVVMSRILFKHDTAQ